jgi:hypothetical protein
MIKRQMYDRAGSTDAAAVTEPSRSWTSIGMPANAARSPHPERHAFEPLAPDVALVDESAEVDRKREATVRDRRQPVMTAARIGLAGPAGGGRRCWPGTVARPGADASRSENILAFGQRSSRP